MFLTIDSGVRYAILAALLFLVVVVATKLLIINDIPSIEIVFFRNIIALPFVLVIILRRFWQGKAKKKGGRPLVLASRGIFGASSLILYFYNMSVMNLGQAMTFLYLSPVFVAILGVFILGETLNKNAFYAITFSFIGMLLALSPFGLELNKYSLSGIFCGLLAAMAYICIRSLKDYYDTPIIVLSLSIWSILISSLALLIGHFFQIDSLDFILAQFVMPNTTEWLLLIILSIFATLSQLAMTKAYALSKANIIAVVSYINIPLAIFADILLGSGLPSLISFFGTLLIIFGGILVSMEPKNKS